MAASGGTAKSPPRPSDDPGVDLLGGVVRAPLVRIRNIGWPFSSPAKKKDGYRGSGTYVGSAAGGAQALGHPQPARRGGRPERRHVVNVACRFYRSGVRAIFEARFSIPDAKCCDVMCNHMTAFEI